MNAALATALFLAAGAVGLLVALVYLIVARRWLWTWADVAFRVLLAACAVLAIPAVDSNFPAYGCLGGVDPGPWTAQAADGLAVSAALFFLAAALTRLGANRWARARRISDIALSLAMMSLATALAGYLTGVPWETHCFPYVVDF